MDIRKYFTAISSKKLVDNEDKDKCIDLDKRGFTANLKSKTKVIKPSDNEDPIPRKRQRKIKDDSSPTKSTDVDKEEIQIEDSDEEPIIKKRKRIRNLSSSPSPSPKKNTTNNVILNKKVNKIINKSLSHNSGSSILEKHEMETTKQRVTSNDSPKKINKLEDKPMNDIALEDKLSQTSLHKKGISCKTEVMLVDKYKPQTIKEIIGQQGDKSNVKKLLYWLSNWHCNYNKKPGFGKFATTDGAGFKAALLSGPPGIGKTTSAQLVCKELGYSYIELNASDSRSKKSLTEHIASLLDNMTLTNYFLKTSNKAVNLSSKHAIIMDEVDGVAGNEDRGGIAELIQLIKRTKIPIFCICNDRTHPKLRSLANYCFDLRFYKPRIEQIKGAMLSVCFKEKINVDSQVLTTIIQSTDQDIRQVLHYLSFISSKDEKFEKMPFKSIKDVKLGPFDALRAIFTNSEHQTMSFQDKSNLFFCDYSLMPLFVYENYLSVNPLSSRGKSDVRLEMAANTIKCLSFSDLIEAHIRSSNNWSLLPLQAAFTSVMPSYYMSGSLSSMINFPALLGKISNCNKRERLRQELKMHMSLKTSGNKAALNLDYLYLLKDRIFKPLKKKGLNGVEDSFMVMDAYSLRKDDIDSIIELTMWKNQKNPLSDIDSKIKASLTKICNSKGAPLPYSNPLTKTKKKTLADVIAEDRLGDLSGYSEEEEEEEEQIIKPKKVIKKGQKTEKSKENKTSRKQSSKKSK